MSVTMPSLGAPPSPHTLKQHDCAIVLELSTQNNLCGTYIYIIVHLINKYMSTCLENSVVGSNPT